MEDYTIDYEEYYNRQMVGCVWDERWDSFKWTVNGWYCTNFTAYWNSYTDRNNRTDGYNIYHCSSSNTDRERGKHVDENNCCRHWKWQSYWQYAALFTDAKSYVSDEDDEELGYLLNNSVDAIKDADNIQELYLISHDWKRRLYFRRKNVATEDEPHYKIQILRLRWFDAWEKHNFGASDNKWVYDWVLDTWACDYSMWFEPANRTNSVGWAYGWYYLPQNVNDCWVDFTQWSTNVSDWKIAISPKWDADLYRAKEDKQINAYMRIMTVNSIYWPALFGSWDITESIKNFKVPLQTTINMKDFYRWYSE